MTRVQGGGKQVSPASSDQRAEIEEGGLLILVSMSIERSFSKATVQSSISRFQNTHSLSKLRKYYLVLSAKVLQK